MYSGTTLRNASGNIAGAHQKIDKVARRHVASMVPDAIHFPRARQILHFEGKNGPDGIKSKSPARDEPWHYIDPTDPNDTSLYEIIAQHHANLVTALADEAPERAAFEAAWLAHAIVDGLTPAHHYPLEAKLEELREGQGLETRTSVKDKVVLPGTTRRQKLLNNWEFWGAKGVMTTHFLFEIGVASAIAPMQFDAAAPHADERIRVERDGYVPFLQEAIMAVYDMHLYDEFHRRGWTQTIAKKVKRELVPLIIKTVTLVWYDAARHAAERQKNRGQR